MALYHLGMMVSQSKMTSANIQQRWTDEAQQYSPYLLPFGGTENDCIGDDLQDKDCNYEQAAATDERLENPV